MPLCGNFQKSVIFLNSQKYCGCGLIRESWNLTDGFEFSGFRYFLWHSLKQNLKNTSDKENKSNPRDVYNSQH